MTSRALTAADLLASLQGRSLVVALVSLLPAETSTPNRSPR